MSNIPETVTIEFPDLRINDYTITGVVGEGGQGVVLALEKDGIQYTGKVINRNWSLTPWIEEIKGLRRGVEISEKLDHSAIQKVTEVIDQEANRRFIVVKPYIPGKSLREIIDENKSITPQKLIDILSQSLVALDYLHDPSQHPSYNEPICHRDIKPENIIIDIDNKVTIIDLDTAKPSNGQTTRLTTAGTKIYAAPEALLGSNDARSDLYSLGFVAVEALLGSVPEELSDSRLVSRKAYSLPKNIPKDLAEVIEKMVLADADQRFQSAKEVREALRNCLEDKLEIACIINEEIELVRYREYSEKINDIIRCGYLGGLLASAIILGITVHSRKFIDYESIALNTGTVITALESLRYLLSMHARKKVSELEEKLGINNGRILEVQADKHYKKLVEIAILNEDGILEVDKLKTSPHEEVRELAEEMLNVYNPQKMFTDSYPHQLRFVQFGQYYSIRFRKERRLVGLQRLCEDNPKRGDFDYYSNLKKIIDDEKDPRIKALAAEMEESRFGCTNLGLTKIFREKTIIEYAEAIFCIPWTKDDERRYNSARETYKEYVVDKKFAPRSTFCEYNEEYENYNRAKREFLKAFPEFQKKYGDRID